MADKEIVLRLIADTVQAQSNLRVIEDQIKSVTKELSAGTISADKYDKEMQSLSRSAAELKGELKALEAETKKQNATQDKTTSSGDKMIGMISRWAGPMVIGLAIKKTADWADNLSDLSDATGISTTNLQKLERAAVASGKTLESVTDVVYQMSKRLGDGDKSAVAAINKLGLNFEELKRQDPADTFLQLARAVAGIQDPYERAKAKSDLFVKSAKDLDGFVKALNGELGSSLPVASEAAIGAIGGLSDAFSKATVTGKALLTEVIGRMAMIMQSGGGGGNPWAVGGMAAGQSGWSWGQQLVQGFLGVDANGRVVTPGAPNRPNLTGAGLTLPSGRAIGEPDDMGVVLLDLKQGAAAAADRAKALAKAADEAAKAVIILPSWMQAEFAKRIADPLSITQLQSSVFANGWGGTIASGVPRSNVLLPSSPLPGGGMTSLAPSIGGVFGLGAGTAGFGSRLGSAFGSIAPAAIQGIFNGGNVGSTLGGLGGGALASAAASSIAKAVGGTLGSTLGSVVPVLGTLAGAALGKLIGGAFGPSRKAQEDAAAQPQIDALIANVLGQYGGRDKLAAAGNQVGVDVIGAFGSRGKQGYAELSGLISELSAKQNDLNGRLEKQKTLEQQLATLKEQQKVSWETIYATAEKYGVTTDAISGGVKQDRSSGLATALLGDFQMLTKGDGNVGGVLFGMREEFSAFVNDTLKAGTQIPENLRPMIEELARSGNLFDENRAKVDALVTQMAKLGSDAPQSVRDVIGELVKLGPINDTNKSKVVELSEKLAGLGERVPAEMRPLIDQLLKSAGLVVDNKDKITDLSNLKWGEPVKTQAEIFESAIKDLTSALQELIDSIKRDFPNAVKQGVEDGQRVLDGTQWRVPDIGVPDSGDGAYMNGGIVYAARGGFMRGTDAVLAALTPGEFVFNREAVKRVGRGTLESVNRGGRLGGGDTVINIDARDSVFDGTSLRQLADRVGEAVMMQRRAQGLVG